MNKKLNSNNDLVLLGAGGHAKVVIDTLQKYYKTFSIIGITEKVLNIEYNIFGIPIIGNDECLKQLYSDGLRKVFISLGTAGNCQPRANLYKYVKEIGFECINVIHGTCILSDRLTIGEGNAILAGTIINTEASIGNNCIVNTGSIIEHECLIGNNVHIAPGVKISGRVVIGDNSFIGIGSSIIQGIKIGENCIIGAGSVVVDNIPPNTVSVGIPAKVIKAR